MIVIVSGEGPTDIGRCLNSAVVCEGGDYSAGAMGCCLDALLEPIWGYSPMAYGYVRCVTEKELNRLSDALPRTTLPGKKKAQETGYFFKNAAALGAYAVKTETNENCEAMAVLFRDADGTRSTQNGLWQKKVESIRLGFLASEFERGVPMVPRPKSEVWLLCAMQAHPYQNCARFESISGNDHSPNSAKKQLEAALNARNLTYGELPEMITEGAIVAVGVDMPSYNAFRVRLQEVAQAMIPDA